MAQIKSIKSGKLSDDSVWSGPIAIADQLVIDHEVLVDTDLNISGISVNGTLKFDPDKNIQIRSRKNIVVTGLLEIIPSSDSINHSIIFENVNEDAFQGNTMTVQESDIGLWVMEDGKLNIIGHEKTSWTNAIGSISNGQKVIEVKSIKGWKVGDEVMITPTAPNATNYDERIIEAINGNLITLNSAATSHPSYTIEGTAFTPEVANLTRNVRIEGTSSGRTHIFIKSTQPQFIKWTQIRYVGPRKNTGGNSAKEFVLGRYGIHFHHSEDGSRGSIIFGNVMRDSNSHCYVPHSSHGIMMCSNIAYKAYEAAFWYDQGHPTHDLMWRRNLAADLRFVSRALQPEDDSPTLTTAGFMLGMGDGNMCTENVVVGCTGLERTDFGGAYDWEANNEGVWLFKDNLAHNCVDGIRVWQNSAITHIVEDFNSYNNKNGIFHGAYANAYKYIGGIHFNSPIVVHAASEGTARVRFENLILDGGNILPNLLIIEGSPLEGFYPVLVRNCKFRNFTQNGIIDIGGEEVHHVDIINCDTKVAVTARGEIARVQDSTGESYQVTSSGKSNIAPFAPTLWGSGDGVIGEYYSDTNFRNLAFTRVDAQINFLDWPKPIHHLITTGAFSIRWKGKLQPQYTETYTFSVPTGIWGTAKLVVNGKNLGKGGTIALKAGELYDYTLEFSADNPSRYSGVGLVWSSNSLKKFSPQGEIIPQSQLYSGDTSTSTTTTTTKSVPQNKPPQVDAGTDISITLPTNVVTLSASASDEDGTITSSKWTVVSGPSNLQIGDDSSLVTSVSDLQEGTYIFRITVVDNELATAQDTVTVFVKAAPNMPPSVSAGANSTISISVPLEGTANDSDGTIESVLWEQVAGPSIATIDNPNSLETFAYNLIEGTYRFRLTVEDNRGGIAQDTVTKTITK